MIEEQLQKHKFLVSEVEGNSMLPFLHSGVDKVVISKDKKIEKYDVVLYKNKDNKNILHRVVKIENSIYFVRGDNSITEEKVDRDNILGVLAGYYNTNGYVETNKNINRKYYLLSMPKYLLRKLKKIIV